MKVTERSVGDVAELTRRAREETKAIQRDRYRAVLMALDGREAVETAAALGRARRSVQDWAYAYRDGGVDELLPGKSPGRPAKLPREREGELKARLPGRGPHARRRRRLHAAGQGRGGDPGTRVPPPYSPELNPAENLWHHLRSHYLSNRTYDDYDALLAAGTDANRRLTPAVIRSVCRCPYLEERAG
ncbi:MAG TPA: helix-turn-helix domain-containing protein [Tepidisphaeraceae bacterium]|nr:helix-turn-helix domain-containing protein [Tepidisphaeraceae bacterium]